MKAEQNIKGGEVLTATLRFIPIYSHPGTKIIAPPNPSKPPTNPPPNPNAIAILVKELNFF